MKNVFKRLFQLKGSESVDTVPRSDVPTDNVISTIPANLGDVDEKMASPVAVIYQSELDYISRCVLDYPNIETGGDLFGFWTNEGIPIVLYAIGPGKYANHQDTFFVQDVDYFVKIASSLNNKYQLSHMGEWHSHHQLGLARPSGHDANTIFKGIQKVPLRRMLLCIANYHDGKTTVNPYTFHESDMLHYVDASWRILPIESPYRRLIDQELGDGLIHPRTLRANHGALRVYGKARESKNQKESTRLKSNHWMRRSGGVDMLRKMIEIWKLYHPEENIYPQWDEFGNIFLSHGEYTIKFSPDFPVVSPTLNVNDATLSEAIPWTYNTNEYDLLQDNQNVLTAFEQWTISINNILNQNNNTTHDDISEIS